MMNRSLKAPFLVFAVILATVSDGFLIAQEAGATPSPPERPAATDTLQIDEVERKLAELESSDLDDAVKSGAKVKFEAALAGLRESQRNRSNEAYFREAISTAPKEASELLSQLELLPGVEEASKVEVEGGLEGFRKEVEARRATLAELDSQLKAAESELAQVKGRPVEVGARLPQARSEQVTMEAKIAALGPAGDENLDDIAERMELEARLQALDAEVAMLEQEQLSQAVRERLVEARRDLLKRRRGNEYAALSTVEDRLRAVLASDAESLTERTREMASELGSEGKWVEEIEELTAMSVKLTDTAKLLEQTDARHDSLKKSRDELAAEFVRTREQVDLGGLDGSFAQILFAQGRSLPNPRPLTLSIGKRGEQVRELRLAGFRVEEKLREHEEMMQEAGGVDEQERRLLELRGELLGKLRNNYRQLVRELSLLDTEERAYHDLIIVVQGYLRDKLFWLKSSPPVGANFAKDFPEAVRWVFGAERWREGSKAVLAIPRRHPVIASLAILAAGALMVVRSRLIASLEHCGKRIRLISTDRYVHTLRALLDSVLLAIPLPLVVGVIGWGLLRDPHATEWVRGLGQGLSWSAIYLVGVLTLREISRPGGLGMAHFGWCEDSATMFRVALGRVMWVYVPASLVTSMTLYEESSQHFDSVGRLAFNLSNLWIALVTVRYFNPSSGVFARTIAEFPDRMFARLRYVWFALLVGTPIALILLASLGYLWTAITLGVQYQGTLRMIAIGAIVYGLLLRWFMMNQRKMALKEAIALRQAKREAAATEVPVETGEETAAVDVDDIELDLEDGAQQTRRLLRSLVGIGVVVAVWWMWGKALPLDEAADQAEVGKGLSWLGVLKALLIGSISLTVAKNLPGILDLAGLRDTKMDAGARYAFATICQYVVYIVGAMMVFKVLNLDLAQFGWIAAALSVGLGFGLQEIVANFVCGIILLFERPIRVGDVVVVDGISGSVSRIRMRATTITNWDREDFVVPNKQFITGSLINCTLSNKINRLTIPVGVAYGSDTGQALAILLEVAKENEHVMDDPAPFTAFDQFADSTLNLVLRCYLPNRDNRLRATTELHSEIDRRFKEAGIEIAFPQQDLHLRSVDPGIKLGGKGAEES